MTLPFCIGGSQVPIPKDHRAEQTADRTVHRSPISGLNVKRNEATTVGRRFQYLLERNVIDPQLTYLLLIDVCAGFEGA